MLRYDLNCVESAVKL